MCTTFDKWRNVFLKEDGKTSAIDGLKEVFSDEDNNLLLIQLDLTNATGVEKEALERRIALKTELHKARTAALPLLTDDQRTKVPEKREKINKSLETLEDFYCKQQGEANLLEKVALDEENNIKTHIKKLQHIATEIKAIDAEIQEQKIELVKKEMQYEEDISKITDTINKKEEDRTNSEKEFNEEQKCISFNDFKTKVDQSAKKKKLVKQSKVIIDYIKGNLSYIVAKLATQ